MRVQSLSANTYYCCSDSKGKSCFSALIRWKKGKGIISFWRRREKRKTGKALMLSADLVFIYFIFWCIQREKAIVWDDFWRRKFFQWFICSKERPWAWVSEEAQYVPRLRGSDWNGLGTIQWVVTVGSRCRREETSQKSKGRALSPKKQYRIIKV